MENNDNPIICIDCRLTGAIHCHDPFNCSGPWGTHAEDNDVDDMAHCEGLVEEEEEEEYPNL